MSGRRGLLCALLGHEAPRAHEDPTRCRYPGCDAPWPPTDMPPRSGMEFPAARRLEMRFLFDEPLPGELEPWREP